MCEVYLFFWLLLVSILLLPVVFGEQRLKMRAQKLFGVFFDRTK